MRRLVSFVVVAVALLGAQPAFAAWVPGSTGTGQATAHTIDVPTGVTAVAAGPTSIQVSWTASSGVSPTAYVVSRTSPSSATVCTTTSTSCTDIGLASGTTYTYAVTAWVGNWTSGPSASVSATTSGTPTFLVTSSGIHVAGSAFTATVTATTNGSTVDTSYTGTQAIAFSGPSSALSGTAPSYPASATFAAGVAVVTITLYRAETPTLVATDGTRSGAVSFTVSPGTTAQLRYTGSCNEGTPIAVGNGGSWSAFVTTTDSWWNLATQSADRTVTVSRAPASGTVSPSSVTVPSGSDTSSASTTFTLPIGNPPTVAVTAASGGLTPATCMVSKHLHP